MHPRLLLPVSLLLLAAAAPAASPQLRQMRSLPFAPTPPEGPAIEQFLDFPIQIRVLDARWNFDRRTGDYIGWGHADILGNDAEGLDFTYNCSAPFEPNLAHGEFYEAQWRKPEVKLDILVQPIGGKHVSRCTLKVTLKAARYAKDSATWLSPPPPPSATAAPIVRQGAPVLQRPVQPPPASAAPPQPR
jgi:hypothetical protein